MISKTCFYIFEFILFFKGTGLQLMNVAAMNGNSGLADFMFTKIVEWDHMVTTDHCMAFLQALTRGNAIDRAFEVISQFSDLGIKFTMSQLRALANEIAYSPGTVALALVNTFLRFLGL